MTSPLTGYSNIDPVLSTDTTGVVIDRINENSTLTNAILADAILRFAEDENLQAQITNTNTDISDLLVELGSRITSSSTDLTTQSNYNYLKVQELINAQTDDLEPVEFLPIDPVIVNVGDTLPTFYFNITSQTLMVLNRGNDTYYPAFGCESITDATIGVAPLWEYVDTGVITPPTPVVPTPPTTPACFTPLPALSLGESRVHYEFPVGVNVITAHTYVNITYILSKNYNTTDIYSFDITTDTLSLLANVPYEWQAATIMPTFDRDSFFIIGGKDGSGNYLDEIYEFDLLTNTLTLTAELLPENMHIYQVSYSQDYTKAYAFGGQTTYNYIDTVGSSKIIEIDTTTGATTTVANYPHGIFAVASSDVASLTDKIYLFGGRKNNSGQVSSIVKEVYEFDTITYSITLVSTLPTGRSDGLLYCGASEFYYSNGYWIDAMNCVSPASNTIQIFPFGTTWSSLYMNGPIINATGIFGNEVKECKYATQITKNPVGQDQLVIFGID